MVGRQAMHDGAAMSAGAVRRVCAAVFVLGIAGMIVASIADNSGAALTAGLITAAAALCLIVATTVTTGRRPVDDGEVLAEQLEGRIGALVAKGADEAELRDLVRTAVDLGRTR